MPDDRRFDRFSCTRRDLLKLGGAAAAASALSLVPLPTRATAEKGAGTAPVAGPGYVVKVHLPGMRGRWFPYPEAARVAVDRAVSTLAGESDPKQAWRRFLVPEDRVGIKINVLGGRMSATTKEVVDAIIESVRGADVPDSSILVFDQLGGNMRGARYAWQEKPGQLRVLNHEVMGFEPEWTTVEGGKGKLSKALTWSTAIINVPVIKDHDLAGVTCAMKNMVFGCVESPHLLHRNLHTVLPRLYARDEIRGRVRLTIVDGSFCLFDGGPKHNPAAHVTHDCIYAATDPVAIDAIALEVVEGLREKNGLRPLEAVGRPATYLALAAELGLGIADRKQIRLEAVELPAYVPPSA